MKKEEPDQPQGAQTSVVDPWHFGTGPDPRIRTKDIQIRIRIWILLFWLWLTRCQQKKVFFQVFLLITFWSTFTSVFKDKKSKRHYKIVEVKVFLTFLAWWWKDLDPCKIMTDPDPGDPKTYRSGSTTLTQTVNEPSECWHLTNTCRAETINEPPECCNLTNTCRAESINETPECSKLTSWNY